MENDFYKRPILNSPYECPNRHWELDRSGQPTQKIIERRRHVEFITPIPPPRKHTAAYLVAEKTEASGDRESTGQNYELVGLIDSLRQQVDEWRELPNPADWRVSPETERLLQHWRSEEFNNFRPFFCQVEAIETLIWLTEVAPEIGKQGRKYIDYLREANAQTNLGIERLALKMATGAGKTAVMAMLIAWQTINTVRSPGTRKFTCGFLVTTPSVTIRERLRVLMPNDPENYYVKRELVPRNMLRDLEKAKVAITNYHAFIPRDVLDISKEGRALLEGRQRPHGRDQISKIQTQETEGEMLRRVMPALMGIKRVIAINDEAHHCYRQKIGDNEEGDLEREDKKEAEKNEEAARVWFSGLEVVQRTLGLQRVIDLSATPFFLRGSGYAEGTIFPWTMTDFSLMDAIECGIVKLPRVPVADNVPKTQLPMFRNLWHHIKTEMPRPRRGGRPNPLSLPAKLLTALHKLYDHYEWTFNQWKDAEINVPPCFIVVCNNILTSKLICDYVSGFYREQGDGVPKLKNGELPLFRNFDDLGQPLARPHTLLVNSEQIDSGAALDPSFRKVAADAIERFRREKIERASDKQQANQITDEDLLREVVNTVGKEGCLGESIRCVVSVSMLTEGWDARTVTHILGVRAFSTQLLCEQVVGRSLRRQSYDLNDEGLFDVEYADVFGVPFDFMTETIRNNPKPPRKTILVQAISPDRDVCEITFPRVVGYHVILPDDNLVANFTDDDTLELTPEMVGASTTHNQGILGEGVDFKLNNLASVRRSTILFRLTKHLLETKWCDPDKEPKWHLFGQLKRIVGEWFDNYLKCRGGTMPSQIIYLVLADIACEKISRRIKDKKWKGKRSVQAMLDSYNPVGSTKEVCFPTRKTTLWKTDPRRCHINWAVYDSNWEAELCRIAEAHPRVRAYVKNHSLGFEVPYKFGATSRKYRPDFIVRINDGMGDDDLLNLVVEVKGYRGEDAKEKKATMDLQWVPSVNRLTVYGRWQFAEFGDPDTMQVDFDAVVNAACGKHPNGR